MNEHYSIQKRLQARLVWLLILLAVMILLPVHLAVRGFVDDIVEARLEHDAESLIAALNYDPNTGWALDESGVPAIYKRVASGHYFRLLGEAFNRDSRSLWDRQLAAKTLPQGEKRTRIVLTDQDERLMSHSLAFKKNGQQFTLWVAEDLTELYRNQIVLEASLALLILTVITLIVWLQRRMIATGFAVLTPIQETLNRGDISTGLELPEQTPQEIQPLMNALHKVLSRSATQIKRSRTGLGNLAHELKRPVQKLHWLANEQHEPLTGQKIREAAQEFERLMNRELRRARISGNPTPGLLFNPREDLEHLLPLFGRIYGQKVHISTQLPHGDLPYDRDDLLELIGNLLDNACRYAATHVKLTLEPLSGEAGWQVLIDDDGPGVSAGQRTQLCQRGIRLDEGAQQEGSGLGISISLAVAESYGGTLDFTKSPLGGLRVIARLPV